MHEIDLKNFAIHTDLAIEKLDHSKLLKDKKKEVNEYHNIKVNNFIINDKEAEIINKKPGMYTTIFFNDTTDSDNQKNISHVLIKELKKYLVNIKKDDLILVVGLGNDLSTPDSLGPKVIDKVMATNHLYELNICSLSYQRVAVISPSVTGKTGIETFLQIKSIVENLKPKMIIAIDSLASSSVERVNKTIQITDTGINPGSGIGNMRKELSINTLNVPVIAIGVPTVVDASSIVFDTINYMHKKYSFSKYNSQNKKYLLTYNNINYLNEDIKVNKKDKEVLLGLVGKLSNDELKDLINEVLSPIGYNLMVTTKEIDFVIENLVDIIGNSLNKIFSN